jgi:hypothetical protein
MASEATSACRHCGYQPSGQRDAYLHRMNNHVHAGQEVDDKPEPTPPAQHETRDAIIGFAGLAVIGLVLFLLASSVFRACSDFFETSPYSASRTNSVSQSEGRSDSQTGGQARSAETAFEDAWSTLTDDEKFSECFRFVANEDSWIRSFKESPNPTPSDAFIRSFLRNTCPGVIERE